MPTEGAAAVLTKLEFCSAATKDTEAGACSVDILAAAGRVPCPADSAVTTVTATPGAAAFPAASLLLAGSPSCPG